jgi:hypothetical protein
VLRGHIDAVTTLGVLEGWAYDTDDPVKPLEVAVFSRANEVAWGLAHRFRTDLMTAGYGVGWCAFRLRLSGLIADVRDRPLRLLERPTGAQICIVSDLKLIEDTEPPITEANGVTTFDPTVIEGTWQLQQCEELFLKFISVNGLETFLSVAYAYMLGRPVDRDGLMQYSQAIRNGSLTPLGVLEALEKSEDFRFHGRRSAAPSAANFPFI